MDKRCKGIKTFVVVVIAENVLLRYNVTRENKKRNAC